MNEKFSALQKLGAGEFEHLHGSLVQHLNATYKLLQSWNAPEVLCDAGLYHAAYGTAGFESAVVSLSQRNNIAEIIGQDAEELVYLYCACDRSFVFNTVNKNIGNTNAILFRNRFTQKEFMLTQAQARYFCELTVANELELALSNQDFLNEHGQGLYTLFIKLSPFLSQHANVMVERVLNA